ncbi:hypothetical protein SPI_00717 [Niveomyces insectorum RCEF 264]|uniref:DUF1445 domain containing protein n=1 Tax=Niveomyces insectorum RCEF 264 TaxID=1081102 RepID=A0A162JGA1_9HYPO|nr:hypothetical protein SPI_00717 [Niveomyces insectorum RCEF 264]
MTQHMEFATGHAVRLAARLKALTGQTANLAPTYLQANLIVLPSRYADDFRLLCKRNPVPCPLLAESAAPGSYNILKSYLRAPASGSYAGRPPSDLLSVGRKSVAAAAAAAAADTALPANLLVAADVDLRHDFPKYYVYANGRLACEVADLAAHWTPDHVGFLIGCSYSFEAALAAAGLPPRHNVQGRNVPMYRATRMPLCPAGVFAGGATYVVSMRPYRACDVERVRDITRPFERTHGEPVAWGWDALERLGIRDVATPEYGDGPVRLDDSGKPFGPGEGDVLGGREEYVPVFWGCGVTPQEAVMTANLEGTVMAHVPGHMLVLDVKDHDAFSTVTHPLATL